MNFKVGALILPVVVAAVVLVACSPDDDAEPSEPWAASADYTYTVVSSCGERWFLGTYEVEVVDRVVVEATPLDASAQSVMNQTGIEYVPSLDDLVDEYRQAVAEHAMQAEIVHAEGDGHPIWIDIDWSSGLDDESCYRIEEYRP